VNDDGTLGLDFAVFVDGLTPVGGAVGRLRGRYDERHRIAVGRHLVSLVLEDLLTVAVPVHLGGRVAGADAAAEYRLLRRHPRRVGQFFQQLRRRSGYEQQKHSHHHRVCFKQLGPYHSTYIKRRTQRNSMKTREKSPF